MEGRIKCSGAHKTSYDEIYYQKSQKTEQDTESRMIKVKMVMQKMI